MSLGQCSQLSCFPARGSGRRKEDKISMSACYMVKSCVVLLFGVAFEATPNNYVLVVECAPVLDVPNLSIS